jgi:AcrR family transcriptional regulator
MNADGSELPRKRMTRAEAKARTRALLLEAAARTFARKGFAGASVEEIAETAGFSIGALYSNFGSKDQLFVELLSERAAGRVAEAARILGGDANPDPVHALGQLLVSVADKDADFALLQAEFWLYAMRNPGVLETLATQNRETREALTGLIITRAPDLRAAAEASPDTVATVLLALFRGLVQLRRTDPGSVPDDLFGQAVRWLFSGIGATAPPLSDNGD